MATAMNGEVLWSSSEPIALTRTKGLVFGRLDSLDSLRGLAAMTVVLNHVKWLYKPNIGLRYLRDTTLVAYSLT
jgi:hypothetical protein